MVWKRDNLRVPSLVLCRASHPLPASIQQMDNVGDYGNGMFASRGNMLQVHVNGKENYARH